MIAYCKPSVNHAYYLFSLNDLFKVVAGLQHLNKEAVTMSVNLHKQSNPKAAATSRTDAASPTRRALAAGASGVLAGVTSSSTTNTGTTGVTPRAGNKRLASLPGTKNNAAIQPVHNDNPLFEHHTLTMIARVFCHECCRTFRDRFQTFSEGQNAFLYLIWLFPY